MREIERDSESDRVRESDEDEEKGLTTGPTVPTQKTTLSPSTETTCCIIWLLYGHENANKHICMKPMFDRPKSNTLY